MPWLGLALCGCALLSVVGANAHTSLSDVRRGGIVRIAMVATDLDSLDPALAYAAQSGLLLDTTCARLLASSGHATADGSGLAPEVAAGLPRRSRDGRTYTFTLRDGFRFSDGTPVRADAFARAIDRTLAPGVESPWATYTREIVGAADVTAGRSSTAAGVVARGRSLVVRLRRPVPDFPAQVASFLCAVPPTLPSDPEGIAEFAAAGPYFIAEYRPGDRVVLRRNRFYGGSRRHHVDGFDVDLRVRSPEEVLDRIESGEADWGPALSPAFDLQGLAAKYGINRSRFFLRTGSVFRGYAFNTSRPLFRNNPQLRRAVSFAIDRSAFRRAAGGPLSSTLTDQYLPPWMRGFRDARIYPLQGPDLDRARALARGHTRSGKVALYTIALPHHVAFAQSIKRNLAKIGLDVEITRIPRDAYFARFMARGDYDLGFATWVADYDDPFAVLNVQLDGKFIGGTNWPRFDSPGYNRRLRDAASLQGPARYRAYGELDARLARDAAPMVAIDFLNEANLVSERLGCVTASFDLTAVCLK